MRKDTAKSSAFDINLSRKHRAIGAEIGRINARQIELLKKYAGNLSPVQSELTANANRLAELEQAAHALVPFDAVAFEKYAATLFQNMQAVIVNDAVLSDGAINYATLNDAARAEFGVRLYQKMAQKYGAADYSEMQFILATHDGMGGGYDWDKTIRVSTTEITDFAGFVSVFVHEFSHYVYNKLPHKSPINAQLVNIAKQNYVPGPSPTKAHFEKYKNQPFEKPSYALMDYFANHDFVGKLALAIKIKQNTLSWGME
ncbi:MAG: hypothetical protein IKK76_03940 [Alphaproteobacteria bacterium]|nr:hypothetical protein [Alphaproteobacteria bacterium]